MLPEPTDMVLELLAGGGRMLIDADELPVWVTVTKNGRQKVDAGGSITQALARACRSLKAKEKEEVSDG